MVEMQRMMRDRGDFRNRVNIRAAVWLDQSWGH